MKFLFYTFVICMFFQSCMEQPNKNGSSNVSTNANEMIVDMGEDWGGDITLSINQIRKLANGDKEYKILSFYKKLPIGFILIVKPSNKKLFVGKGITFKSLGDTSNNFIQSLAQVYNVSTKSSRFKDSIVITYTDLNALVKDKEKDVIAAQMKMFFETDDDAPELYLNIDENKKIIQLNEKDSSYRQGILKALSK